MRSILSQLTSFNLAELKKFNEDLKKHLELHHKDCLVPDSQNDLNNPEFQAELGRLSEEGAILQIFSPAIFKLCSDMNKKVRAEGRDENTKKTDIEKASEMIHANKTIAIDYVFPVLVAAIKKSNDALEITQIEDMVAKCEILLEVIQLIDPRLGAFSWGLLTLNQALDSFKHEMEEKLQPDTNELIDAWAAQFVQLDSNKMVTTVVTPDINDCLDQLKELKLISAIADVNRALIEYEDDERKELETFLRKKPVFFNRYCKNQKDEMKPTHEIISFIKEHPDFFEAVKPEIKLVNKCSLLVNFNYILNNRTKKCSERLDELENIVEGAAEVLFENRSNAAIRFFRCLARVFHLGGRARGQKLIEDKLRPIFRLFSYCIERDKIQLPKFLKQTILSAGSVMK